MADIYGSHFMYGDVNSMRYGLVLANADTSRIRQLNGTREGVSIYNKKSNKRYLVADDLTSSPLSFDIDIVTESGRYLETYERRMIEKWLFGNIRYRKLYIESVDTCEVINGVCKRCYLNCRFVNPEKIEGNGGIIGYKATLEADSDMLWQDPTAVRFDFSGHSANEQKTMIINVDTDSYGYLYPIVKIQIGENGGDVTIFNSADDSSRETKFEGVSPLATIMMNGESNYVSNGAYSDLTKRNFVRLVDGENTLCATGDITAIDIEYSARRFL